jgi:hypothetical protein
MHEQDVYFIRPALIPQVLTSENEPGVAEAVGEYRNKRFLGTFKALDD